jgi:hypothetical protein
LSISASRSSFVMSRRSFLVCSSGRTILRTCLAETSGGLVGSGEV